MDHAVAVVDARGTVIDRFDVDAAAAGLRELVHRLRRNHVAEVAIERSDSLVVVDALLEAGLTVVVIAPNQVNNLRGRYGSARNKDDRFDAFVLADTLRTDRARLRPLIPDTPATVLLRATVRARRTCSPTGSGWPTSSAPTSRPSTPDRSDCSPTSTA